MNNSFVTAASNYFTEPSEIASMERNLSSSIEGINEESAKPNFPLSKAKKLRKKGNHFTLVYEVCF
jgi:pyridoxal biosynthesis lyase PdxS